MAASAPQAASRSADERQIDFVPTGPGTLAGRYMRMFWQPVYRAQDLPAGRAVPIRIMSEDFTLYRGDAPRPLGEGGGEGGKPHLLAFRCAHRGTQLSTGWVEGDDLRCFYHGWKYDASGQCIEQPAEPEPFCQKIRIRSYPTEEYLGLIFAHLGEGDAPPMPRYPDFEEQGILEISTYVRGCNYFNALENEVDLVGRTFAHRFHNSPLAAPTVSAEPSSWGITVSAAARGASRLSQLGMPNIFHHLKKTGLDVETGFRDDIHWRVPIDDESHSSFSSELVHATGELAQRYLERAANWHEGIQENDLAESILAGGLRVEDLRGRRDLNVSRVQDYLAQAGSGRIADRQAECLGGSDVALVLLRQLWREELRSLEEGRALRRWQRPPTLRATAPS